MPWSISPQSLPGMDREAAEGRPWPPLALALALALLSGLGALACLAWRGVPPLPRSGALFHDIPPGGLRLFLAAILPAAAVLPSLALAALLAWCPLGGGPARRRALGLDLLGSLALPLLLPLILLWSRLPQALVLSGVLLLTITLLKGAGLVIYWAGHLRSAPPGPVLGWRRALLVALTAFCLLSPLEAWVGRAFSAAGDEVRYLMMAHSLARHGTSEVGPAVAAGEYRAFYTGAWHSPMSWDVERAGSYVFHLLLTPAYFLGGRLAVLLLMAALSSLAAAAILAWLWRAGLSPPAAGAAVLLTFAAAPVLNLSQHALPDVPGLLLLAWGLLLLQRLAELPLRAWLGLAAVALGLVLLKNRLSFLAAGLLLAGAVEQWSLLRRQRPGAAWLWAALALAVGVGGLWAVERSGLLLWDVGAWGRKYLGLWLAADSWWHPLGVFLGGVGLDQEHGILLPAPIFLLALAGLPAACRRLSAVCRQALVPALTYGAVICFLRWDRFFGGNGPAGRFVAVVLPVAALFIAFAWQHLQRRGWRLVPCLLGGLSLLGGLALTLAPAAQFHRTNGVNQLLGAADRLMGYDLHHLFPSSFVANSWWWPWLLGGALLTMGLAWVVWRDSSAAPPAPSLPWAAWEKAMALALPLAGLVLVLGLSKALPPASLEAEQMSGERASLYGLVAGGAQPIGRSLVSGGRVWGRLHHPGGRQRLVLVGYCGAPGRVSLFLDGQPQGSRPCPGPGKLTFPLPPRPPGYMRVEVAWQSCPERKCYLFVDRLDLQPRVE